MVVLRNRRAMVVVLVKLGCGVGCSGQEEKDHVGGGVGEGDDGGLVGWGSVIVVRKKRTLVVVKEMLLVVWGDI